MTNLDRRGFLTALGRAGIGLGAMSLGLPSLSGISAEAAVPQQPFYDSVLQLFFLGGPSQTDTWDPKPGSRNNVFGTISLGARDHYGEAIQVSDVFPNLVSMVQQDPNVGLGLIRSLSHQDNEHRNGQRYMHCFWDGAPSLSHPSTAAVMAHYAQGRNLGLSSVVIRGALGEAPNDPKDARIGAALEVEAPRGAAPLSLLSALKEPVGKRRYARRLKLLDKLNSRYLAQHPEVAAQAQQRAIKDAVDITRKGDAARAFDLSGVPLVPGRTPNVARRLTLASRLIEFGTPHVVCGLGGNDSHSGNRLAVENNWGVCVDGGVVEMVSRIKASGRRCLILLGGEFGRTPQSTANGRDGRDHYGDGFSWAMISVNQPKFRTTAIGSTGPDGVFQQSSGDLVDPIRPRDLGGFVYRALGFDPARRDAAIPMGGRTSPPVSTRNRGRFLLETVFGLK